MIESQPFSVEGLSKEELQIRRRKAALDFFSALSHGETDAAVVISRAEVDPEYMDEIIDHLDAFTGIRLGIVNPEMPEPIIDPETMDEYTRLMNSLDHMLGIVQQS